MRITDWWAGARPGFQAADYILTVDVRNPANVHSSYGLMFGISGDWSQFYTFEIEPNGNYAVWRYSDSSGWSLQADDWSAAINTGTASNQLKIVRNGAEIIAYANGQHLSSVSDGAYTGSRYVGLIASSYDQPNLDMRFDNFTVYPVTCGGYESSSLDYSSASPASGMLETTSQTNWLTLPLDRGR